MRKAREGVEQGHFYPEPAWITARPKLRFWYRFWLGRPMDGQRWTDSTFWRSATRGEDQWWLRLAGWHRAVARVAALTAPTTTALAVLTHQTLGGRWALLLLAAQAVPFLLLAVAVLTYRVVRSHGVSVPWLRRSTTPELERRWEWGSLTLLEGRERWLNERVRPVARTVAAKLNRRYHPKEAAQWVSVPRDYRELGGRPVEILLPQSFVLTEAARRTLANAAAERLGMRDPQFTYELEGNAPRLLLTAPTPPPEHVSFADMLPTLERSPEFTFVLGMLGSEALSVSLKDDSPHLALSAGSGAGKSELIKLLVAQVLHRGWSVLILDWKEESQEWADGLPGVRYVRDIASLHDACVQIGEEVEWRKANRGGERRRLLVVSEEWGITAPLLADYWSHLRSTAEPEERRTMPLKSPAATALMKLNFTGRSLGMCQLLVAQRFSARVTNGNADLRESFTTIFMSRWKAQTFKMLAPDVRPIPRKLTKPGQWLAVTGDEVVRFQAGLWTDEEAREWALAGETPPVSPWSERYPAGVSDRGHGSDTPTPLGYPGEVLELLPHPAAGGNVRLRKLSDLVDDLEHLGVTSRILRDWRDKEAGFPSPKGGAPNSGWLYDQGEVTEFARRKRASQAAEKR